MIIRAYTLGVNSASTLRYNVRQYVIQYDNFRARLMMLYLEHWLIISCYYLHYFLLLLFIFLSLVIVLIVPRF